MQVENALDNNAAARRKRERPHPLGSFLFTDTENQQLFQMLGPDRISLSAGIAQLLRTNSSDVVGLWQKYNAGVVVLIKDYSRKCYVIEMFDIFNWNEVWSQTMYKEFRATYYPNCPRFITFEGDECIFGLNFSDYSEAENFKTHLNKRSAYERNLNQRSEQSANHQLQKQVKAKQQPTLPTGITMAGTVAHFGNQMGPTFPPLKSNSNGLSKKDSKKNNKKNVRRPRKEDISNPTGFKHLAHVGWNQDGGLQRMVDQEPMDDSVRDLLRAAGQNPDCFNNDEIKFVYKFLEEFNADNTTTTHNNSSPLPLNNYQQQHNAIQPSNRHQNFQPCPGVNYRMQPQHQQNDNYNAQVPLPAAYGNSRPVAQQQQPPPPRPPPIANDVTNNGHRGLPQLPPNAHRGGMPSRQMSATNAGNTMRSTPNNPPPPPPPPPPKVEHSNGRVLPPPPPPLPVESSVSCNNGAGAAPPPPPPPPPPPLQLLSSTTNAPIAAASTPNQSEKPKVENGRSNLLQEIQAGAKLKHVDVTPNKAPVPSAPPTNRDNMMEQIKQGAQLKHVDAAETENRKSSGNVQELGGIAGALARALEERRRNLINSEESGESENDNDSEWEED